MVRSRHVLHGTIVSPSGPVPMAEVLGLARDERGVANPLDVARASARVDGRFELRLPGIARWVDLILLPPRHALDVRRLALPASDALVLSVSEAGGVVSAEWASEAPTNARKLVLWSHGVALDPTLVSEWALSHGGHVADGSIEIPMLAPGDYEACLLAPDELLAVLAAPTFRPTGCEQGTLEPLGRLALRPSSR